jgi:hypothetical protein
MSGLRAAATGLVLLGLVAAIATGASAAGTDRDHGHHLVALLDDCDGNDPAWNEVGGCTRKHGNVTTAEFDEELDSPLAAAVIGHQAWRNDPAYLVVRKGARP